MTATVIATAIAIAATAAGPPDALDGQDAFRVASVEVTKVDACAHIAAYDDAGDFAGVISICADEAGQIDVDADFADDLYLSFRGGGDKPTIESNGAAESIERMHLVLSYLDPADIQAGWGGCLISAGGMIASAVAVQFVGAMVGAYATACSCVPLLDEEFAEIECPFY